MLSFFYANPEFSSDSTSIATLHSAVVAQLSTLDKNKRHKEDGKLEKDDDSQVTDDTSAGKRKIKHCWF